MLCRRKGIETCRGECRETLLGIKMCGLNQFGAKRNDAHPNRWGENGKSSKGNLCASPASKSIISSHDFYCSPLV